MDRDDSHVAADQPVPKEATSGVRPYEVFVVDTDVHVRALLTAFLTGLGCELRFFDDGYAALDAARRSPPALVITEVIVPQLDGLALCRLLKGDAVTSPAKVIILSFVSAEPRARESRADIFVKKPINRRILTDAVRAQLNLTEKAPS